MDSPALALDDRLARAAAEVAALRRFPGAPKEFWPRFAAACGQLARADVAVIALGRPTAPPRWLKIAEWTAGAAQSRGRADFADFLEQAAERALAEGSFLESDDEAAGAFTLGVRLALLQSEEQVAFVAQVVDFTEEAAREALARLALAADAPGLYQSHLASSRAQADVEKFATVLDLMVPVNGETRFLAALLALANGIATRLACDRVSVAWQERGYLRLKAISRTEKFDRQMAAAQALEAAMEECADQDEEIVFPTPAGATSVARDHEKFAREQSVAQLASLPLREAGKVVAVLTCERQTRVFSETEMAQLRLLADQVMPRLAGLHRTDRWPGARLALAVREGAGKFLGPEKTWAKICALAGAVALLALFVVQVPYRVEGSFILRSNAVSFLTAPFDGYIESVAVQPGDALEKGAEIVRLDRADLLLQKAEALAQIERYEREAQKAEAARQLAEMQINHALAKQARADLATVEHRLAAAILRAPFAGVVVEGDLRERIASPVKVGEALYKIARLDGMFLEAEVDERDVREILHSTRAEFSFVSQPNRTFSAKVLGIEPAALPKKEGNVFLVRLAPEGAVEAWWRPGMTGLAKVAVERRTLWWIGTHRTVDFLRLKLWW